MHIADYLPKTQPKGTKPTQFRLFNLPEIERREEIRVILRVLRENGFICNSIDYGLFGGIIKRTGVSYGTVCAIIKESKELTEEYNTKGFVINKLST